MCGISGYFQQGSLVPEYARRVGSEMADALAHRGPDDAGVWLDSRAGIVLAHRRLAVIDLSSTGKQPMLSHSGRYVIVFNGEIYNHADLRSQVDHLFPSKIPWKGSSDTEIFLEYIEHFGIKKALDEAIGMFALGLWDRVDRILYLARDRIGEKPLYYGWSNNVFLFGSELKALVRHPQFEKDIDRDALALFLRYSYIPTPWSIYRGIQKLTPGTYVQLSVEPTRIRTGELPEAQCYWSLSHAVTVGQTQPLRPSGYDIVDTIHDALSESVRLQMVADAPVGAFLSGGIDSSIIVALMQTHSSQPTRTFTIGFEDPRYDEATWARRVARHLRTDHNELYISNSDTLDIVPRLPLLYDEPFADSSQIPTVLVAEMARKHVTVALSGDGGDELFGGYDRYARTRQVWSVLSLVPRALRESCERVLTAVALNTWCVKLSGHDCRIRELVYRHSDILGSESGEEVYYRLLSGWKHPDNVVQSATEPPTLLSDRLLWPSAPELESRMMAIDTLTYLPDSVLVKVDRAAMSASLETRAPFLNHRVVECAWRLPLSVKIRKSCNKWILREVLSRYIPRTLMERDKKGLSVPLDSWLRGPLKDWAESLLCMQRLHREGFFLPNQIRKKMDRT